MDKLTGGHTVAPAYGRDYKSAKEAKAAFLEGVDFIIKTWGYPDKPCSIRDFAPGASVSIRYKKLTAQTVVKVGV